MLKKIDVLLQKRNIKLQDMTMNTLSLHQQLSWDHLDAPSLLYQQNVQKHYKKLWHSILGIYRHMQRTSHNLEEVFSEASL